MGSRSKVGDRDPAAYLPVLAFADALPATLAWAQERGVPPSVVAATLADVGRMMTRNRQWEGRPGLGDELAGWLTRHLVGSILQVGRLQHERADAGPRTGVWLREDGAPYVAGDVCVNLHIPETGPLRPDAVGESLRAGRTLLRRRFPEERLRVRFCVSWLLDPQLAEYLPEGSNIRAFQELFRIGPAKDDDGDVSVRKFVFGNTAAPVGELPQRTALERAAVAHWQAGRHWRVHVGRIDETRAESDVGGFAAWGATPCSSQSVVSPHASSCCRSPGRRRSRPPRAGGWGAASGSGRRTGPRRRPRRRGRRGSGPGPPA